jgi:hypothetical protein
VGYYNSFVVRIWSDEQGPSRGTIEHVSTHDSLVFDDPSAVVSFIRLHLDPPSSFISDGDMELSGDDTPQDDGLLQ